MSFDAMPDCGATHRRGPVPVAVELPAAATALLTVGGAASPADGAVPAREVLLGCLIVVGSTLVPERTTAPPLLVVAWLTVDGFSRRPYAQLRRSTTGFWRAAGLLCAVALCAPAASS